jgi:hypothetical protein
MFRFFAVLCLAFCPIAASAADTIPAEHFAQLPFLDDPEISPDGKYIAARFAMGGKQYLGIHGLFEKASPVVISMGETELKSWDWINNDWLVLRVGAAASVEGSQDWYLQRIVTVNRTGTKLNRPGWNEAAQNAAPNSCSPCRPQSTPISKASGRRSSGWTRQTGASARF